MLIHSTGDTLMYYYSKLDNTYRVISYIGCRVIFDKCYSSYEEALRLYNHCVSNEVNNEIDNEIKQKDTNATT